jgi:hypothetical protein
VMAGMGMALMGTGVADGEHRAVEAAQRAISSPLLEDASIHGAQGVLINITGGEDMTLHDVNTATTLIYDKAGDNANIIFGAVVDPAMSNQMRVTVIATGIGKEEAETKLKQEVRAKMTAQSGKAMSLFPEEAMQAFPHRRVVTAPEAVASVSAVDSHEDGKVADDSGNGHGYTVRPRNRVPVFSEEDRTIPAYIRRLEDN